ncbi:hypothetical protein D3C77_398290 [compost metagenome]
MTIAQQYFEQASGQLLLAFDGLVRIGVGTQVDRRADITWLAQLLLQHLGGVGLGDQPGFEVQPGGQVPIGMTGARITVNAAVLTTAIGIDRAVEGQVGRVVAGNDALGGFASHLGTLGQRHLLVPAVILGHRMMRGEAVVGVVGGATPP